MIIAVQKNKYGLDPFQICFPQYQKYYGSEERDSPWPLILRNMYSILYGDERRENRRLGMFGNKNPLGLFPEKTVTPKLWSYAFNVMCVNLREKASPPRIDRPEPLDVERRPSDRKPVFRLLAAGKQKVKSYYASPNERKKTAAIIKRMKKHMSDIVNVLPPNYKDLLP